MTEKCPLCSGSSPHWLAKSGRDYCRCNHCGLIWIAEGLVRDEQSRSIYEQPVPVFIQDGNARYYLDETSNDAALAKLQIVRRYASTGVRLLDVGSGFGHFLGVAKSTFDAVGLELSPFAVEWSRRELQVQNFVGSLYDIPRAIVPPFDVVTCWDVIEHLEQPRQALEALANLTKSGGLLFLSTPDAGSVVARLLGRHWYYLDPVQHIALFNRANLTDLAQTVGFSLVKARSIGRTYRLEYILERLLFLYRAPQPEKQTPSRFRLPRRLVNLRIPIRFGDVMLFVFRKR